MTTAARPTFEPARGGRGKGEGDLSALSKQYSSRDLPGHTKIKYRSVPCFKTRHFRAPSSTVAEMKYLKKKQLLVFSLTTPRTHTGSPPRMHPRRCVPVTSVASWRRGSAWPCERRPERGGLEVGLQMLNFDLLERLRRRWSVWSRFADSSPNPWQTSHRLSTSVHLLPSESSNACLFQSTRRRPPRHRSGPG